MIPGGVSTVVNDSIAVEEAQEAGILLRAEPMAAMAGAGAARHAMIQLAIIPQVVRVLIVAARATHFYLVTHGVSVWREAARECIASQTGHSPSPDQSTLR